MKLFVPPKRVNTDRALGQGWELAITLCVFFVIGFLIDRWLESTPIAMIVATLLGSIGVFAKMRYAYEEQMAEHDRARDVARGATPSGAERSGPATGGRSVGADT